MHHKKRTSHAADFLRVEAAVLGAGCANRHVRERRLFRGYSKVLVPPSLALHDACVALVCVDCELPDAEGQVDIISVVLDNLLCRVHRQCHRIQHRQRPSVREYGQEHRQVVPQAVHPEGKRGGLDDEQGELLDRKDGLQVMCRREPEHSIQAPPAVRQQCDPHHERTCAARGMDTELKGHHCRQDEEHHRTDTGRVVFISIQEVAPQPDRGGQQKDDQAERVQANDRNVCHGPQDQRPRRSSAVWS
mmetsp:Transcript_59383/g.170638  ORF Transcript_59383/g.170638 Transcript_59383/m.170638 type:complete len:247 (-) Transcript_59383:5-745(-)